MSGIGNENGTGFGVDGMKWDGMRWDRGRGDRIFCLWDGMLPDLAETEVEVTLADGRTGLTTLTW